MYQSSPKGCHDLLRLPVGRCERCEVFLVSHPRQLSEDVFQVRQGILPVAFAGDDQGVEDRGALASVGMTDKQPSFFADARRAEERFRRGCCRACSLRGADASRGEPTGSADNHTPCRDSTWEAPVVAPRGPAGAGSSSCGASPSGFVRSKRRRAKDICSPAPVVGD